MIRRAEKKDIPRLLELLVQVNMVHHIIRPDLFNAATKYSAEDLEHMVSDDHAPIFVNTDENDRVLGYAFCVFKQVLNDIMLTDIKTLYIDDLCVDETCRGRHVGKDLYEYVLDFARKEGCYNVTLNVWCGNDRAMDFYNGVGLVPQKIGMEKIL